MIDTTRWVLVETWLSMGLRVEWCGWYSGATPPKWQNSEGGGPRFFYVGDGRWKVEPPMRHLTPLEPPELSTSDMRHELAHYIAATSEERAQENFGMGEDKVADVDREDRATMVENGLAAMIRASSRIAGLALGMK